MKYSDRNKDANCPLLKICYNSITNTIFRCCSHYNVLELHNIFNSLPQIYLSLHNTVDVSKLVTSGIQSAVQNSHVFLHDCPIVIASMSEELKNSQYISNKYFIYSGNEYLTTGNA